MRNKAFTLGELISSIFIVLVLAAIIGIGLSPNQPTNKQIEDNELAKRRAEQIQRRQERFEQQEEARLAQIATDKENALYDIALVPTDPTFNFALYSLREKSTNQEYLLVVTPTGVSLTPKFRAKE